MKKNRFEQSPVKTSLFLIFMCILGLEIGLQIFHRIERGFFTFQNPFKISYVSQIDSKRIYSLRPNIQAGDYTINQQGYRGKLVNRRPDVLMLGDSVPFGAGVKDDQTYPYYLSDISGLHIINGGVPSYTLWQSVLRWKEDFKNLFPKVVTFQASNDVSLFIHYGNEWQTFSTWWDERWNKKESLSESLSSISAIYHYISTLIQSIVLFLEDPDSEDIKIKEKDLKQKYNIFFGHMISIVDDLIKTSIETETPVVLIPINPFYYTGTQFQKNKEIPMWNAKRTRFLQLHYELFEKYNEMLRIKTKQNANVFYFDIVSIMDNYERKKFYRDYIHHTPGGNKLFATFFHKFLQDNGLLKDLSN